ncbi:MAG: hypothetical protein MRY74_01175 [Neomegalonema sp.]|nr:hypothetical protein [Neomegalonema sp.]
MDQLFQNTPIWLWLVLAAVLGAAAMWAYWRCLVQENQALAEAALADRDAQLQSIQEHYDEHPLGVGPAEPAAAALPIAALAAETGPKADGDEAAKLRYRVWALETRLRRVQDGVRAGEALDASMVGEGLDEVDGDGPPPREVAELKFAAWRAAQAKEAPKTALAPLAEASLPPKGAPAEPGAAAALAARADRLEARLARTLAAAKGGRLSELQAIEDELAADKASQSKRFGSAFEPVGSGDPSSLRFRNWLLSATLTRVLEQARAGWPIDPTAVSEELEAAARGAAKVELPADAPAEEPRAEAAPADKTASELKALSDERDALADESSGLRYRVWMLGRGLDPDTGAERFKTTAEPDGAAIEKLTLELTEAKSEADAATGLAEEAQETIDAIRAELEEAKAEAATAAVAVELGRKAEEQSDALRARIERLEPEVERLTEARRQAVEELALVKKRVGADADAARQLRSRASLAEAGLRAVRAELADASQFAPARDAAQAELATVRGGLERATAENARLHSAAAATEARLWSAEWRLANARTHLAATVASAEQIAQEKARLVEREGDVRRLRSDTAVLRSRLWSSEWRLKHAAASVQETQRLKSALAAADNRPPVTVEDPKLRAERDRLTTRVRELEVALAQRGDADEAELRRREAETLRARLALAEAEATRMRAALVESAAERAVKSERISKSERSGAPVSRSAGAALAAAREAAKPDPFAARMRAPSSTPEEDTARAKLRRELEPVRGAPLWGVETAALELIDSRSISAITSPRPTCLLDRPSVGEPDDLTLIAEVTPKMADAMRRIGLFYFHQFEECAPRDLAWIDDRLSLRGAVVRERWTPQARQLAEWKRAKRLKLNMRGYWTVDWSADEAPAITALAPPAPEPASVATVRHVVNVDRPMSGAEYAMLDLIADPKFDESDAGMPAELRVAEGRLADDLTRISGVDTTLATALARYNVTTYRRIAEMTPQAGAWLDRRLGLGGRIPRERWQPQARALEEIRANGGFEAPLTPPAPKVEPRRLISAEVGPESSTKAAPTPPAPIPAPAPIPTPHAAATAVVVEPKPEDIVVAPGDAQAREAEAGRLIQSGSISAYDPAPLGMLDGPPAGGPDDLKLIETIGPKLEARLNDLGVWSYDQLARFSAADLAWIDISLGLGGRIMREGWARQAVEMSKRKAAGDMSIGGEGAWTLQTRVGALDEALHAARSSPYTAVEAEAMRLISGGDPEAAPRPSGLLDGPSGASPDDLKQINGVGPNLERLLNDLGVYYFSQIAEFSASDLAWIDTRLKFKGRIVRDRWAPQAVALQTWRQRRG